MDLSPHSLDSHYVLFDEAEKDFDIDSFLAPFLPSECVFIRTDEETVLGSPISSPKPSDIVVPATFKTGIPVSCPVSAVSCTAALGDSNLITNENFGGSEIRCEGNLCKDKQSADPSRLSIKVNNKDLDKTRPRVNRSVLKRRRVLKKEEECGGRKEAGAVEVALSQLDLLNLTAEEYEELVWNISSRCEGIHDKLNRQSRRLIKNRDGTQTNRQRKNFIEDLERKVNELVNENAQLKETVSTLTSDKSRLENEVLIMRKVIGDTKKDGFNNQLLNIQVLNNKTAVSIKPNYLAQPITNKGGAIVLLMILFSFGLLFNHHVTTPTDKKHVFLHPRDSHPGNAARTSIKRDLSEPPKVQDVIEENTPARCQEKTNVRVLKHVIQPSSRGTKRKRDNSTLPKSRPKISSSRTKATAENRRIPQITQWRPNTTYLMCSSVSQIIPPTNSVIDDPDVPLMISLLIPPDSLGEKSSVTSDSFLQVSCHVMDISSIPLSVNDSL